MGKKTGLAFILIIAVGVVFYFKVVNAKVSLPISKESVKDIYCEYGLDNIKIIPVSEADKDTIISEISKGRKAENKGDVATVLYRFVVELKSGEKYYFIQDTHGVISIWSAEGNFSEKIKAPETAKFILRYVAENSIDN
jgi:hypothetical protein